MKPPRRSLASRVIPFVVVYLGGAATSAVLAIAGGGSGELVPSAADAAPLQSIARRVEASREQPLPPDARPEDLRVAPVVVSLPGRPAPLVLDESSRVLTDLSERGSIVPMSAIVRRRPSAPRLDPAQIRGTVASNMSGLRRCYERVTRRQGDAQEEHLQVELRITGGEVRSASVSGASSALLERCVTSAVRSWRFPEGSAQVSLPVRLRPREG